MSGRRKSIGRKKSGGRRKTSGREEDALMKSGDIISGRMSKRDELELAYSGGMLTRPNSRHMTKYNGSVPLELEVSRGQTLYLRSGVFKEPKPLSPDTMYPQERMIDAIRNSEGTAYNHYLGEDNDFRYFAIYGKAFDGIPSNMYDVIAKHNATGGGWSIESNGMKVVPFNLGDDSFAAPISLSQRMAILDKRLRMEGVTFDRTDIHYQNPNGKSASIKIHVPINQSDLPIRRALDKTFLTMSHDDVFGYTYPLGQHPPRWSATDKDYDAKTKIYYFEITNNLE